jgi:hypothetical protein
VLNVVRIRSTWNDDSGDGDVSDGGGDNNKNNVTGLMIQYEVS